MTDRRARHPAGDPPPVDLAPPAHLTRDAAAVWTGTIAALGDAGTLDQGVLPLIERRAVWHARWRDAEARLAAEGAVVGAPKSGVPMVSPWHGIARTAAAQLAKVETELGIAPTRRGRVRSPRRSLRADGTWRPAAPWDDA